MRASIDDVIATAATHLLMVQRHTPEQVADYLVRMARWSEAKAAEPTEYEYECEYGRALPILRQVRHDLAQQ